MTESALKNNLLFISLQYAFLVTASVQFAGGVIVFFGLLTSPKEVGKWKRAVAFQSLLGEQICSFPCSTKMTYPQGSYKMVLHFSVFNGANALLAKITLNTTMHHVYRIWTF